MPMTRRRMLIGHRAGGIAWQLFRHATRQERREGRAIVAAGRPVLAPTRAAAEHWGRSSLGEQFATARSLASLRLDAPCPTASRCS